MKLVFTREEVAAALGKSVADFEAALPSLHALGFPNPVRGLETCWSIMDVIRWVNREEPPTMDSVMAEIESAGLEEELLGRAPALASENKPSRH
jgi:hypothetical protein